jgi:hypothetical protein
MEAIVKRLMRKKPEERFQSPRELIGALEAYEVKQRQKAAAPEAPPRRRPGDARRRR